MCQNGMVLMIMVNDEHSNHEKPGYKTENYFY
jgi:hypothetical protein